MNTEEVRTRLLTERARIEELRHAANRLTADAQEATERELSSAEQHPAELASETIGLEIDHSVLQHAELELVELEAAVKRVDNGVVRQVRGVRQADQRGAPRGDPDREVLHRGPGQAGQERAAQRALGRNAKAGSVAEVALPGEHDRHAECVGGLGDLQGRSCCRRDESRRARRPCPGSRGRRASGRTRPRQRPLRLRDHLLEPPQARTIRRATSGRRRRRQPCRRGR